MPTTVDACDLEHSLTLANGKAAEAAALLGAAKLAGRIVPALLYGVLMLTVRGTVQRTDFTIYSLTACAILFCAICCMFRLVHLQRFKGSTNTAAFLFLCLTIVPSFGVLYLSFALFVSFVCLQCLGLMVFVRRLPALDEITTFRPKKIRHE
jgi:hypothetical protein